MDQENGELLLLQERCRKDPSSYYDEFISQRRHFDALLSAACLSPSDASPRLAAVASFMGAVAHCYGKEGESVGPAIATFLSESGPAMHPDLRRSLVRLLGLLRARKAADANVIIPLFFRLLACNDKNLRRMLHGHIVSDIKKIQASGHSSRRSLQTFLFGMMEDPSEVLVKRSLHVLVDLFRKKIWNDAKCANMIANACFHPSTPVAIIATRFILDSESKDEGGDSDEDDGDMPNSVRKSHDGQRAAEMWKVFNMTGKKTSKKRKRMEKTIGRLTRTKTSTSTSAISESNASHPAFEAMMLLNDPQEFSERLFKDLQTKRRKESYENRLIFINLISRLVGTHQLILFNFYPFLQRYLQPSQPEVTRVLAYLTQACHDLVPSDVLHPILRGLADTFVSERSSPPAMAAGINSIRAICARVPLAILDEENEDLPKEEQESPLLEDLVQYKTSKDKGVMMAARSLISLYREVHPGLLHKRDRGRAGTEAVQKGQAVIVKSYGEQRYATGVDGVELLAKDSDCESDDEVEDDDLEVNKKRSQHVDEDEAGDQENGNNGEELNSDEEEEEVAKCEGEDEGKDSEVEGAVEESDDGEDDSGDEISNAGVDGFKSVGAEDDIKASTEVDDGSKNKRVDEIEILTNEDFAKIRARKAAQDLGLSSLTRDTGDAVDPDELQGPIKRERRNLQERMASVLEGREGREKFGSQRGKNKGGGSTNKKKLKTKSNSMVIHKRRKKSKISRRDKQISKRAKRDYK